MFVARGVVHEVELVHEQPPLDDAGRIAALLASDAPFERVPVGADEVGGLAAAITPEGDLRTRPDLLPDDDPRLAGLDGFFAARLRRRL